MGHPFLTFPAVTDAILDSIPTPQWRASETPEGAATSCRHAPPHIRSCLVDVREGGSLRSRAGNPSNEGQQGRSADQSAELRAVDAFAGLDQLARRVDLVPDVPEQEPARLPVVVDVGDDAFAIRLGPFLHGVEA